MMILLSHTDRPRPTKVFALVKFFSEFNHAQQFLDGGLFMRRLAYFRRQEDAEGRWDSTEGVWVWLQRQGLQIRLNAPAVGAINITERDLAAPVSMSLGEVDNLYIYCMYAYYIEAALPGDGLQSIHSKHQLAELEAVLQIDPRCLRFGRHAVVIPFAPFLERLKHAARIQSLRCRAGLVRYYDDEILNGEFKLKDVPFRKQRRFDYQREFRFCVQNNDRLPMPRNFNIGSLRELARYVPSEHLLNAFKLSLEDEAV